MFIKYKIDDNPSIAKLDRLDLERDEYDDGNMYLILNNEYYVSECVSEHVGIAAVNVVWDAIRANKKYVDLEEIIRRLLEAEEV